MSRCLLFLVLAAAIPAAAQQSQPSRPGGPVVLIVPEYYVGFDPATAEGHPEAVELHAVIEFRPRSEGAAGKAPTVVLLNPAHLDPGTLRAALVAVHNYRARGEPQSTDWPKEVITQARAAVAVPDWLVGILSGTLDDLRRQPQSDGPYGVARSVTIADPSAIIRRLSGRRGE